MSWSKHINQKYHYQLSSALSTCYDLLLASNGIVTLRPPTSSTFTLLLIRNLLLLFARLQFFKLFDLIKLFNSDGLLLVRALTNATVLPTDTAGAIVVDIALRFARSDMHGDDGVSNTSEFERLFRSFGGINELERLRIMPERSIDTGSLSQTLSHVDGFVIAVAALLLLLLLFSPFVYMSESSSPFSQ